MGAAIEANIAGFPMYPDGTAFVAADLDGIGAVLVEHARERSPIVIVYPDGEERLLVPSPRLDSRWTARVRGRLRRAAWRVLPGPRSPA